MTKATHTEVKQVRVDLYTAEMYASTGKSVLGLTVTLTFDR